MSLSETDGVEYARTIDQWLKESEAYEIMELELYRLRRYGISGTVALTGMADMPFIRFLQNQVRQSDYVIPLGRNHCFLIFSSTDLVHAKMAMQRIITDYKPLVGTDKTALVGLKAEEEVEDTLKRLLVLFILDHKASIVVDEP